MFEAVRSVEWCEMFLSAAQKDNIVSFLSKNFLTVMCSSEDPKFLF